MKKPWFRKQTQRWYLEHDGRQVNLGPDKAAAFEQYHRIMAEGQVSPASVITVHEIVALYLEWATDHVGERTFGFYRDHLLRFTDFISPKVKVKELRPLHITKWIMQCYRLSKPQAGRKRRPVSDNHRHNAIRAVKRCFKWAKEEGHIEKSPIADVKNYPTSRRETYVSPGEFDLMFAAIREGDRDFQEFVMLMRLTGCRPQEVRQAEKRHFNAQSNCLDFPKGESKGRKDRRVVLLDGEALVIIQRRMARYSTGHLFRNSDGQPWSKGAIVQRFGDLSSKIGFKVTAYTIRHAWATDALAKGIPIQFVAKIMGHKGTRMLMETYNHLELRSDELRAALAKANGTT